GGIRAYVHEDLACLRAAVYRDRLDVGCLICFLFFFFQAEDGIRDPVSAFLLNRSSDLHSFPTRRTLFHVLVGCGLLMLKVSRLKLPVIWLLVSMWLNTLTKSQIWTLLLKV